MSGDIAQHSSEMKVARGHIRSSPGENTPVPASS